MKRVAASLCGERAGGRFRLKKSGKISLKFIENVDLHLQFLTKQNEYQIYVVFLNKYQNFVDLAILNMMLNS